jgi:hypothetical protein
MGRRDSSSLTPVPLRRVSGVPKALAWECNWPACNGAQVSESEKSCMLFSDFLFVFARAVCWL